VACERLNPTYDWNLKNQKFNPFLILVQITVQPYKHKFGVVISFVRDEDDSILVETCSPIILSDKTPINNYVDGG